jgi:hypothetical protein
LEEGDIQIKLENSSIVIGGTPLNDRLYAFLNSSDSLAMLSAELPKREGEMYLEGYTQDEILTVLGNQEFGYRKAMDKLETDFVTSNFDNPLGVMWFMELCHRATMIFGYPLLHLRLTRFTAALRKTLRRIRMSWSLCGK